MRQLFQDQVWCKLRREGIAASSSAQTMDYRHSKEFERLNSVLGGCLDNASNGLYDIGFDFGQMFQFKEHSSGFLGIRLAFSPR